MLKYGAARNREACTLRPLIASNVRVERELKPASYRFIETVLTDIDENGAVDKILDENIDCWTQ